jgi:hypothetical protein
MVGIQFVLLVGKPKSSIAVEYFFREVGKELLEDASTIDTLPLNPRQSAKELRYNINSLLFTELIYECYLNGTLQVGIPQLVETILRDVTTAYGGTCAQMKPLVGPRVHPNVMSVVLDERPENLHTGIERYSKGYVVEHTESWR